MATAYLGFSRLVATAPAAIAKAPPAAGTAAARTKTPATTAAMPHVAGAAHFGAPVITGAPLNWDYRWLELHPAVGAPRPRARAAIMVDLGTRHVLYAANAHQRLPMASTTKLMTAMLALDNLTPDTVLTVPPEATQVEPDVMGLTGGEKVSVETLLYGLLLDSGNDAAETLAMTSLGRARFIDAMNRKAAVMGLPDTHFANPSGLDEDGQYSSAADLAATAAYAHLHYPLLQKIVATKTDAITGTDTHKAFYPANYNKLLWNYPGAIGFKTGLTDAAGSCLVAGATRAGRTIITVELNDPLIFTDAAVLMDYGFRRVA